MPSAKNSRRVKVIFIRLGFPVKSCIVTIILSAEGRVSRREKVANLYYLAGKFSLTHKHQHQPRLLSAPLHVKLTQIFLAKPCHRSFSKRVDLGKPATHTLEIPYLRMLTPFKSWFVSRDPLSQVSESLCVLFVAFC